MKKIIIVILLLIMAGCGNSFSLINGENVDKIEFIVDNHAYLIKEEKYPIIIDALNGCEKTNRNVENLNSILKIVIFANEENETYYLGSDCILVKEEKRKVYHS